MANNEDNKVKIELDRDVANQLIQLKEVGDTYSNVIRKLLAKKGRDKNATIPNTD